MALGEALRLLASMEPCDTGPRGLDEVAKIGGFLRVLSLRLPLHEQRELRGAFVAWGSGAGAADAGAPSGKPSHLLSPNQQRRRKQCHQAWASFRPPCNWDHPAGGGAGSSAAGGGSGSSDEGYSNDDDGDSRGGGGGAGGDDEGLVFFGPDGRGLAVPLGFCELDDDTGLPHVASWAATRGALALLSSTILLNSDNSSFFSINLTATPHLRWARLAAAFAVGEQARPSRLVSARATSWPAEAPHPPSPSPLR